jgi:hypothetical protein
MLKFPHLMRCHLRVLFIVLFSLACLPCAFAQTADFFIQVAKQLPAGIDPDIEASASLSLGTTNGFNSPVSLSCAITPVQSTNAPTCAVSPSTSTPPSSPSLTFTTTGTTTPAQYTVTVTGVSGALTHTVTLTPITVIAVSPVYTLAVGTAVTPSTLHAGSGANAVLNISSTDGYSGMVTPGCSAIVPAVEPSPICTFVPATVTISNGAIATTTLTINTIGPATNTTSTTASNRHVRRGFYASGFYASILAFILPMPFMVIARLRGPGRRGGKLLSLFGLLVIAAGLVTLPACSASTTVNNGSVTPNNSYTFTITAYDANGVAASNTDVTVSLTVD